MILGEIKSEADHEVLGEGVVLVEDEKNTALEANIVQYISVIVPVLGPLKIGTISNRHYIRYTMDCKLPTSRSPSIFYFGSYLNQMLMDFIQIWII